MPNLKVTMTKLPVPRPDHAATRPPKSDWGKFLWRRKIWFETTFGLSVLETWEYLLIWIVYALVVFLLLTGFVKFLPDQLALMHHRAIYYLYGHESLPNEHRITVPRGVSVAADKYQL